MVRGDWCLVLTSSRMLVAQYLIHCGVPSVHGLAGALWGGEQGETPLHRFLIPLSLCRSHTFAPLPPIRQSIFCWGRGEDGQLGLGDTADQSAPIRVEVGAAWVFLQVVHDSE